LETTLEEIGARADWQRVAALYQQFSSTAANDKVRHLDDEIASRLAQELARTFAAYEDCEGDFIEDLTALMGVIDNQPEHESDRFQFLYKDHRLTRFPAYLPDAKGRRRPRPFETAFETVRRIEDLNRLRDGLEAVPSSAILGGSLSYGRFYNVCGDANMATDIDLIVVLPDYSRLAALVEAVGHVEGISFRGELGIENMLARIEVFEHLRAEHERIGFLHKLRMWDSGDTRQPNSPQYRVALHILDLADFQYVALRDVPALENGMSRRLHEYRNDSPGGSSVETSCFAGYPTVSPQPFDEVDLGFVCDTLICEVRGERFRPGVLMNLILPQFEVRWEAPATRIRLTVQNLRHKLDSRLAVERRLRYFEHQTLSLSHTRSAVFAPHVRRRVDRTGW
jgi:hypothetical protein